MYVCMYMYVYLCMYVHVCMFMYVYVCMYVCMYVCLLHLPDFVSHSDGLKRQIFPSKETVMNKTL